MPKKVLVAMPPALLEEIDSIAEYEFRTRTNLIQEALRIYIDNFRSARLYEQKQQNNVRPFPPQAEQQQ